MAGFRRNGRPGDEAVRSATGIFNEYGGFIRAVIRFQIHRTSEQEDLFQEFFLALIYRPVPTGVQNIKSYLYRAIVNHILDSMRMRESYRRAVKKYANRAKIPIHDHGGGNVFIGEQEEEKDATIARFTHHLQKREAQAFLLRYRDNCSIGEIAVIMGVNARTVSRYLSDGLKRLRNTLATQ